MVDKEITFVRHGESEGNIGIYRQTVSTKLTDEGLRQSQVVAERCMELGYQKIFSSTMDRAAQTAQIISNNLNVEVEYSDLFVERRKSSLVTGKLKSDRNIGFIEKSIRDNFATAHYRHSDEETFLDLKQRSLQVLSFLKDQPYEKMMVITHGVFLRIVIATMIYGDTLSPDNCIAFMNSLTMDNAALTTIKYKLNSSNNPWLLCTWNDRSHLLQKK